MASHSHAPHSASRIVRLPALTPTPSKQPHPRSTRHSYDTSDPEAHPYSPWVPLSATSSSTSLYYLYYHRKDRPQDHKSRTPPCSPLMPRSDTNCHKPNFSQRHCPCGHPSRHPVEGHNFPHLHLHTPC